MVSPLRIAVISTVYRPRSHTDVIVSRWLNPLPTDREWGWSEPRSRIASMYVDQYPDNDLARQKAEQYQIPLFASVREALTLGGRDLAVDAILLIGEHGNYPFNELGQKLYPRKALFDQVIEVFQEQGRVVPMFFDKHLSWNFAWAREMYQQIRRLGIPFFGGSSLTYCDKIPQLQLPEKPVFEQAVVIYPGAIESYLFHGLEMVQALIERQASDKRGIRQICGYKNNEAGAALQAGTFPADLLHAALAAAGKEAPKLFHERCQSPQASMAAFQVNYENGLTATYVQTKELFPELHLRNFAIALRLKDRADIQATRINRGMRDGFHAHFARLNSMIEAFFFSGQPPIPLERLLVTSGATEACMQALANSGVTTDTPHLNICYESSACSLNDPSVASHP